MIRLGLVGFGKWGRNYIKAARESECAEVTHVVIRDDGNGHDEVRELGMITRSNVSELREEVDAVVVATGPSSAPAIAIAALEMRLPVLIEKPAALNLTDALSIERAEKKSNAFTLIGHQHLFAEEYERIRDAGPIVSAHACFTGPVSRNYPASWDYGSHAVACLMGLGAKKTTRHASVNAVRSAWVVATDCKGASHVYDGYGPRREAPLTRELRAFAHAVMSGSANDWRFGAQWAVDVAQELESSC